MIYRLIILNGERRGEHITIAEEPMTIGRSPSCDVRIIDPEMAQTHAELTHRPNGPVINDLGSMNRILVNHHEVREATLKHGDIVELGRTRFLLQAYVQAEVTEDAAQGRAWRRWVLIAGVAALILAAVLLPVMCRHRKAPLPTVQPTRIETYRATAPVAALPVVPPPASTVALMGSNEAVTAASPATEMASATSRVGNVTLADQERELGEAVAAMAESKARMMLVDVKDKLGAGDVDGAERLLTEVLWLRPDYAPALEVRARLLEQRGRTVEARKQWIALTTGTNTSLAMQAREEVRRIDAERAPAPAPAPVPVPVPLPAPAVAVVSTSMPAEIPEPAPAPAPAAVVSGSRVRIGSVEISKFPSTEAFREMRLLSMHLSAVAANALPDTGAVTLEVLFYERDRATGAVTAAPERGPRQPLPVEGSWREGEDKVVSASYAVQASESAVRARQFHGFVVRVFHHGALQDTAAQPLDLLTAPGTAGAPAARAGVP